MPEFGVGLHYGATDESMSLLDLATEAQARGFDSVFLPEHSHIPVARRTPYPGGGEVPRRYLRLFDPLTALAMVAARTDLVVGTCVGLPGEHDPIAHAKAVATLDVMSGGRTVLGVGFGWNDDEFENHGFDPRHKHAIVIEKVKIMRALWADEPKAFTGEHLRLEASWAWPKPAQRPGPPILLGGLATRTTFSRVVDWADGWIPMSMEPSASLAADLQRLREMWVTAGRSGSPHIMVMQAPRPADELVDLFAAYRSLGVRRVLLDLPTEGPDVLIPLLDTGAIAIAGLS